MNLDAKSSDTPPKKETAQTGKKKLSRKEKKGGKKETVSSAPPPAASASKSAPPKDVKPPEKPAHKSEEVEARLEPAQPRPIPPPKYTLWEKISPPARRNRQMANMESGFREVLGLVQSMRTNQEILFESFQKLPEAVDSVKKLADHSATQSELLKAMNDQIGSGSSLKFNETLSSMDKTTRQLLERAQRSEERLYGMLRHAQRRIAFMTLLVLLLFVGAAFAIYRIAFSDAPLPWAQPSLETPIESVDELPEATEPAAPVVPQEPVMAERPYDDPLPIAEETTEDETETESEETIAAYIEEDLLLTEDEVDPLVEPEEESLEIADPTPEELGITDVPEEAVGEEAVGEETVGEEPVGEEPVEGGVED